MEYLELLFGEGVSIAQLSVWLTLGLFGIFTSVVFHLYTATIKIKEFSWKIFFKENGFRLILSMLLLIVAMIFGEEIVGIPTSNWSMFLAGFNSDKIVEGFVKRMRNSLDKKQ